MATSKVRSLAEQIRALPEDDRQALAQEVLPVLLSTRAGLEEIDRALTTFSDRELDALIERARTQADLPETTAAAVIGEAVRAVRARVVLDTQVLLRGAFARTASLTARIYQAWPTDRFILLLSESLAAEVESVLSRPEVLEKLRTGPIAARALLMLLRRRAEFVQPTIALRLSRAPGDDRFLECAVARRADYLVSADADLLTLSAIQGILILGAPGFWRTLEGTHR